MDNRGLFDFKKKKKGDKKDRTKLGYTRVKRVMKLFPVISWIRMTCLPSDGYRTLYIPLR